MEAIPTAKESEKNPNKYFLVGGFCSGARFPNGNKCYDSFTGIKNAGSGYVEYNLNNQDLNFLDMLSVGLLYSKTRAECSNNAVLEGLQKQLFEYQPTIIICHSLGCHLFEEYFRLGYPFPPSVKEIRYVQADVERVNNPVVKNLFSPFDPVLMLSNLVNFRLLCAGLIGDSSHPNNKTHHPDFLKRHTGVPPVDAHLDSLNSMKE